MMESHSKSPAILAVEQYLESIFGISQRKCYCTIAFEIYQIINWKKQLRLIALMRKRVDRAVILFAAKKMANNTYRNVHVSDIVLLNLEFKLTTDNSRSSNSECQSAILIGDDFTLLDFDPLVPSSINEFNRKYFQLDFLKHDYEVFTNSIENALTQSKDQVETYSRFNWLQKLRSEADFSAEISNDLRHSESESDLKVHSKNSSPINSLKIASGSNENLILTSPPNTTSINESSIRKVDNPSRKSSDFRNLRNYYQSEPDLLNSQIMATYEKLSEIVNDERQYEIVESKLKQKEDEYCNWKDHQLFVGTWNVNGRIDESISLNNWLSPPDKDKPPSFYVLGFQELDLSIGSVALNRSNTNNLEEKWLKLIENSKPFKDNKYIRFYRTRLAGILLVIYVINEISEFVPENEVMCNKVPTGMLNVMGNKGGVAIRFKAWNSNLCFINCHLAAGESNRFRRDQDFRMIEKYMIFYDNKKPSSIYNHDLVFLMGDLNYRLMNLDVMEVKDFIQKKDIGYLVSYDELIRESKVNIFSRFHEGTIEFLPTYKFDTNTDDYDTSEKNRIPSYCDRIMWMGQHCILQKYSSHMSLRTSDHKPVSAWFNIGLKEIDIMKKMKFQEAIIRNLDLIYNLSLPQAKVDKQEIKFDKVHFYEHRQASISIKNTGQFEFLFKFKEIPGCPIIPDWLTIQPSEGRVKPGEDQELIFEIFINTNNVIELNTKEEVQVILVLDLQGGKDYFITVTAELVPTSFGLPLSLLVTLKKPVATLSRAELFDKCKAYIQQVPILSQNNTKTNEFSTPKEIFVMLDYLMKHVQEDELFSRPGSHGDIQVIREQLDVYGIDANFDNVSVHSITETLLMFLNSLYFPIIPSQFTKECMGVQNNFMESVKVIGKLPHDHQNLFHYLTSFLRRVIDNRSFNGTDIGSLAMLFVDLIFRPKNRENFERDLCCQFIKQFLTNDPVKYFRTNPVPFLQ